MATDIEPVVETTDVVETGGEETQTQQDADTTGINPVWEPIREKLGPIAFSQIEKDLKDMDAAGQQRFTSLNEKYKWTKPFEEKGVTPDHIQAALTFAEQVEQNPVDVYERLGQYLKENGQLPQNAEQLAEALEDDDDESPELDPRLKEIADRQAQLEESQRLFMEQQESHRISEKIDADLKQELSTLEATRKDLTRQDIAEILQHAASETEVNRMNGVGKFVTITESAAWFDGLRNRFLSVQRPGDAAPDLISGGGGNAASITKDLNKLSSQDLQDFIASSLQAKKEV